MGDDATEPADLASAVADATSGPASASQLQTLIGAAARSARAAGLGAVASGRWIADVALESAAHLALRDLATLREQHDGLGGDALAAELIRNASRASGAVGAAAGAAATASVLTPATWAALPLELIGETLLVVAIEMRLVAELHEVVERPITGTPRERAVMVATAWSERRGLGPEDAGAAALPLAQALGRPGRSKLAEMVRRRMMRRAGRNLTSLTPLLVGAAAGALLNRRATDKLGRQVARSLGLRPR